MRIIAFVVLAAMAMGFSILTVNSSGPAIWVFQTVAMGFWTLLIFYATHAFRPRR